MLLGLCGQADLNQAVEKARRAAERAGVTLPKPAAEPEPAPEPEAYNPYVLPSD